MADTAAVDHGVFMTTTTRIESIVSRHHADPTESGRTCRACGRPWPCDVQQIATVLGGLPGITASPVRSRVDRPTRRSARTRTRISV